MKDTVLATSLISSLEGIHDNSILLSLQIMKYGHQLVFEDILCFPVYCPFIIFFLLDTFPPGYQMILEERIKIRFQGHKSSYKITLDYFLDRT